MSFDRMDGMTKMLIDPESDRVLGVGIVGAGAGELIAEAVLAHGNGRDRGGYRADGASRIRHCPRHSWNVPKPFTATRRTRFRRSGQGSKNVACRGGAMWRDERVKKNRSPSS